MITLGLIACLATAISGLIFLVDLASLALPTWVAGSVFFLVQKSGEGLIGAGIIGLLAGALAYFAGVFTCAVSSSKTASVMIVLLYAGPASVAGYHLGLGLGHQLFVTSMLQQFCATSLACAVFIRACRKLGPMRHPVQGLRKAASEHNVPAIIDADFTDITNTQKPTLTLPHWRGR